MMKTTDITADAVALQERDEFRAAGWLKLIAPAKVNMHLAIGQRRDDGYHDAVSIMHALNIHDVVYMRRRDFDEAQEGPVVRMVATGDVPVPVVTNDDNLAVRAVKALAETLGREEHEANIDIRIEKSIPAQAGLGGGSTDAAAALVGAATLWGVQLDDPMLEQTARTLGADVPFFLHGSCSAYRGTGDEFARMLAPSKRAIVLVKPEGGVSTAAAYGAFDENPVAVPDDIADNARTARSADDVLLYNNLAPAAERLMPELAEVRSWLAAQHGTDGTLLCGSGATTFALCDEFATASLIAAEARKRGWWARTTSFGSARVMPVKQEGTDMGAKGSMQ